MQPTTGSFQSGGRQDGSIAKGGWSTGWVHSRWWLRPLRLRRALVFADEEPERVRRPFHNSVGSRERLRFAAQFASVRVLTARSIRSDTHKANQLNTCIRL